MQWFSARQKLRIEDMDILPTQQRLCAGIRRRKRKDEPFQGLSRPCPVDVGLMLGAQPRVEVETLSS